MSINWEVDKYVIILIHHSVKYYAVFNKWAHVSDIKKSVRFNLRVNCVVKFVYYNSCVKINI